MEKRRCESGWKWRSRSRGCHQPWGRMAVWIQLVAEDTGNTEGLQIQIPESTWSEAISLSPKDSLHPRFSLPNSLFPPHHTELIHLYITAHCSHTHPFLPNYRPLDTLGQPCLSSAHYWRGTVPRNLSGLIHLIPTTTTKRWVLLASLLGRWGT